MWELMEEAEVVASQIAKYYASSSSYIQEKISGIYNRFITEHHLTDKEAKQLLNSVKNKDDINALINKIKAMPKSDEKDKFIAELESPAYASRIRRLQEAQDLIDENVSLIYKQDIKRTEKLLKNVAKESYYETMYDIQARTGVAFSFTALDPKKVDKLLKMKWEGRNFSDSIWNNTNALAESLKDELMLNFLTGRTESEAAKKIQEKYLSSYSQARRLVRTESAYVANQMDADAYEEAGIMHYMIVATLDLRTSDICREMDGKIYLLKDKQVGSNYPPFHPWCRTTTVESENPEELKNMKRRARDPETGKNYIVPAGTTYQEWYKGLEEKHGVQQVRKWEKIGKNNNSDKKQYEKYSDIIGTKNLNMSFDEFINLKYNDEYKWGLLKDYKNSRSTHMISSFTPFSQYVEYKERIQNEIVGQFTVDGKEIKEQSKHFIERVFGTTEDPKTGRPRDGVSLEDVKEALFNGAYKVDAKNENVMYYRSDKCLVTLNISDGRLIQTNPQ